MALTWMFAAVEPVDVYRDAAARSDAKLIGGRCAHAWKEVLVPQLSPRGRQDPKPATPATWPSPPSLT